MSLLLLDGDYRATLDLKFFAGLWDSRLSFARNDAAPCATYRDASGVRQTAAANVPRFDHDANGNPLGLLVERDNPNYLLNSAAPVTQTTGSLITGTYTLWCEGSGSVAVAGNTATITGAGTATEGSPVTFVVTVAGTVNATVTGTVSAFQIENFADDTSLIQTGGSVATRAAENVTMLASAFGFNPLKGTLAVESLATQNENGATTAEVYVAIDDGTNTNRIVVFRSSGGSLLGKVRCVVATSGNKYQADSVSAIPKGDKVKIAIAYESGNTSSAVNGVVSPVTLNDAFNLSALTTLRLGMQTPLGSGAANAPIARVRYWPTKLPEAVLQALTA